MGKVLGLRGYSELRGGKGDALKGWVRDKAHKSRVIYFSSNIYHSMLRGNGGWSGV